MSQVSSISVVFLFLLLFSSEKHSIQAQSFTNSLWLVPISEFALVDSEQTRINKIKGSRNARSFGVFHIPDDLYSLKTFSIYVNKKSGQIASHSRPNFTEFEINKSEETIYYQGIYGFSGYVLDSETGRNVGYANLIQDSTGAITGFFDTDNVTFEIQPLGKKRNHIIVASGWEKDDGNKGNNGQNTKLKPDYNIVNDFSTNKAAPFNYVMSNCNPKKIRILFVYSDAAANQVNVVNTAFASVSQGNQALSNSGINTFRFEVANIVPWSSFSESTAGSGLDKIKADLKKIVDEMANSASSLSQERGETGNRADVVVLFTDGDYENYFGFAERILATTIEEACVVVDIKTANAPTYTTIHELAHLLGAQHHPDELINPSTPVANAFGHRFSYLTVWPFRAFKSTIMSRAGYIHQAPWVEYDRIPHFSNPMVSYQGENTGKTARNNAAAMMQTGPTIASFMTDNVEATVNYSAISQYDHVFTASGCGGNGSYSYQWKIGTSPYNIGSTISTSISFTHTFPSWGTWFYELRITDSNGLAGVRSGSLYISESGGPCIDCGGFYKEVDTDVIGLKSPIITSLGAISPNPFNPSTNNQFTLATEEKVSIQIFDLNGRMVRQLVNRAYQKGMHNVSFEAGNLGSGIYVVRLVTSKITQSQRITLLK